MSILSKTLGICSAALVAYDAHRLGLTSGVSNSKQEMAATLLDDYVQTTHISSPSKLELEAKKKWFMFKMDTNLVRIISTLKGYFKGFTSSLLSNIVPVTLAAYALATKKHPKLASGLIGLYAIKYLLFDIMSIGRPNYLKKKM